MRELRASADRVLAEGSRAGGPRAGEIRLGQPDHALLEPPVRVVLLLDQLLARFGLSQAEFSRQTGIDVNRVTQLVRNRFHHVTVAELEAIFRTFPVSPAQVLRVVRNGPLFCFAGDDAIHLHFASKVYHQDGVPTHAIPEADFSAAEAVRKYCVDLGMRVEMVQHSVVDQRRDGTAASFRCGSHIYFGTSLTLPDSERLVARMYGTQPFDSRKVDAFPFHFRWHSERASSLAVRCARNEAPGIVYSRTGELVIERSCADRGTTGGLIVTMVVEDADCGTRLLVAALGHGGEGVKALAQALTRSGLASAFEPIRIGVPRMRAVRARFDGDEIQWVELVDGE
jgi:hypothetical protein